MSTNTSREELTTFLNLQTDYAFKLLFGTKENKHIVIRFLNALLGDWLEVNDVTFHDKEVLPSTEEGKRIVYDVYCTSKPDTSSLARHWKKGSDKDREHHFILEMQNIYNPPFEERMVFYTSKAISSQGKAGWDYNLDPVVAVAVMDFNIGNLKPKLVRDMVIADRESGEVLTEKVHIFLISFPEVPEKWEECRTELEQMTFLIKHMEDMTDESRAYIEGKYAEMFEAARTVSMSEDAVVAYSQSLDRLRDIKRGYEYAAETNFKEGERIGIEKGERIGIQREFEASVRNLRRHGFEDEQIARFLSKPLPSVAAVL